MFIGSRKSLVRVVLATPVYLGLDSRTIQGNIQAGAGKSLVRPGKKQATATNQGYIQHTPHEAQYTS
jgi:hypothetical protein